MWVRLDDERLVEIYRGEFLPERPAPPALVTLLGELQNEPWSDAVWAVTSLNKLRLTTAPSWEQAERFAFITVGSSDGADGFAASFFAAGARTPMVERGCSQGELSAVVASMVERHLRPCSRTPTSL